jgi:hypothetical protein
MPLIPRISSGPLPPGQAAGLRARCYVPAGQKQYVQLELDAAGDKLQ